jgi:hypothetical protein
VQRLATKIVMLLSAGLGLFALLWILGLFIVANRKPDLVVVTDGSGETIVTGHGPLLSQAHWWRDVAIVFNRPVILLLISSAVFWLTLRRLNREASQYP